LLASAVILCIATLGSAQGNAIPEKKSTATETSASKPYKVLTAGKRITVQSKTGISKLLVWTATGHRFVEENNVNSASYSFNGGTNDKLFFIMLEMKDGKRYTEKIGVQ
jgi:hypothetical protein